MSGAWDQFRYDSVVIKYMGTNSVLDSGSITWAYSADVADEPPLTPTDLLTLPRAGQHALKDTAWQVAIPLERKWLKVADQHQDESNIRQYCTNVLYFRADGFTNMPTGTFRAEYTISLSHPVPYSDPPDGFSTHQDEYGVDGHEDMFFCIDRDAQLQDSKLFNENWDTYASDVLAESGDTSVSTTVLKCLKSGTYSLDFERGYTNLNTDYGSTVAFDGTCYIDGNNYVTNTPTQDGTPQAGLLRKCLNKLVWVCKKGHQMWIRGVTIMNEAQVIIGVLAPLLGAADPEQFDSGWQKRNPVTHQFLLNNKHLTMAKGKGLAHSMLIWDEKPVLNNTNDEIMFETKKSKHEVTFRGKSPLRK